jgi:hypothetical protein
VSAPPECGEGKAKVIVFYPGCELRPRPAFVEVPIERKRPVVEVKEEVEVKLDVGFRHVHQVADPVVSSFFNSDDPFIQETVLPNIERYRKSDATVTLLSADGEPVEDASVSVHLKRHEFHFGCAPRRELAIDGPYRKVWSDLWEYAVPENAQKWASIERSEDVRDYETSDAIVDYLRSKGCPIEYHFLSGYHPEWIKEKLPEEQARLQRRHMLETVERYRDSVDYFQVYNEFWRCPVSRADAFVPSKEFFEELTTTYTDLEFGVSDCWRLNEPLPTEEEMLERFPGLDFIAIHAHRPRRLSVEPSVIYECLDPYKDSDIKLHISEFGIREGTIQHADHMEPDWSISNADQPDEGDGPAWTEERKSEYFVQTIMTCFSHPSVRAFNLWGMGPGNMFMDGNRLIDEDYAPLPTYDVIRSLLKEKLMTRGSGTTDAEGQLSFRGFHGVYLVTVTMPDGDLFEKSATISAENPNVIITSE